MTNVQSPHILIVAKEETERDILQSELNLSGFGNQIVTTSEPQEAIRIVVQNDFHLIIYVHPHDWDGGAQYCQILTDASSASLLVIGIEKYDSNDKISCLSSPYTFQTFLDRVKSCLTAFNIGVQYLNSECATLHEIEIKYKDLFDRASDIIMLMNYETHTIVDVNEQAVEVYGYCREEFIGMSLLSIVPREEHPEIFKNTRRMIADRGVHHIYKRTHIKKDGSSFVVSISGKVLELGGQLVVQDIIRDETERLKQEAVVRETEKLKTLLEIAGGASHEINQPLTVVVTGSEMLLNNLPEDFPDREMVVKIVEAGWAISEIVKKMKMPRQYKTISYTGSVEVIDFGASSNDEESSD